MRPLVPVVYPLARVACDMAARSNEALAGGVDPGVVALMKAADLSLTRRVVACGEAEWGH